MKSVPENVNYDVNPKEKLYEQEVLREECGYNDLSEKFRTKQKKDYTRQYAHIYFQRLNQMRDVLSKRALHKWGENVAIKKIPELQQDLEGNCVIIGTLYKDQELRPSILKELSDDLEVIPQKKLVRFVSDSDKMILEDEEERIALVGIDVKTLVTGVECAVLGAEDDSGQFIVEDVCFAGPLAPPPFQKRPKESNKHALFLSGLDLGTNVSSLQSLQLLVHWASGWLGSAQQSISFVLVAGGLIRSTSEEKDGKVVGTNVASSCDIVTSAQLADDVLAELSDSMNVELMPGHYDPTNFLLPQQPIHLRIFPKAMQNKTFNSGPNPHQFQLDDLLVVGCSGEAVKDVSRYSDLTDPLEALEATFRWGHIVPTAPDSLGCFPYYENDPFVLDNQPDIFFSSNHDSFQTKLVEFDHRDEGKHSTRLICIPSFSKTCSGVLVNLSNLEAVLISVDIPPS